MKQVEYPVIYCVRYTGTITQGPNRGMELDSHVMDSWGDDIPYHEQGTLEAARKMAARHRALEPAMKIEICTKQFRSCPKRHFHYELIEVYP